MRRFPFRAGFALLVMVALSSFVVAQEASIKKLGSAPEGIPDGIRALLGATGLEVAVDGKPVVDLWFSQKVAVQSPASSALGVSYGALKESDLVGVARVPEPWKDYRGTPVKSGLYTLRYAVQPADGNHMGVSIYRDFLLMIPVAQDEDPQAQYSHDQLVSLSKKTTGTPHPAVLALFPVEKEVEEPALQKDEMDHWMVATRIGSLDLGVVVVGRAQAEGY